ncbi:MAG: glycosyltransferase [Cyclobacteriaceae bacterium]|nr:glycosyltransferase [Cyclobacteriaceae bacterium]
MKILIASSAFYPENSPRSYRATELAKEFVKQGHQVTLITLPVDNRTAEYCLQFGIQLKSLGSRRLKPIPIHGSGVKILIGRIVNRLLLQLIEYPDIELMGKYHKALRQEGGYDLLVSLAVPYPVHWGVARARKKNHPIASVWVADCGDPYTGNRSDSFRKLFYFQWVERWMFRKTDFISIPIDSARAAYFPEFQNKIVVIPQGVNFEDLMIGLPNYFPNAVPTFAYAGSFMPGTRDPRNFIEYLNGLQQDFRFYIYTTMGSFIQDLVAKSSGRIITSPYLTRKELISTLATMDFLVNFENITTTQAPSKLIDYYLTRRPILSVGTQEVNKKNLHEFLAGNYQARHQTEGYEKFRIENVTNSFLTLAQKHE